jgi:hypothetical protein
MADILKANNLKNILLLKSKRKIKDTLKTYSGGTALLILHTN